jgi:hypothetical protein
MCKVSDQLKLCSCKTKNVEELKHYWVLKRHNGEQNCIVGEAILPVNIGEDADKVNIRTLRKMLNSGNCFDTEMLHQENDILELHFTFHADPEKYFMLPCHGDYLAYAFVYKNDKWRKTDFDPFGENLDDIQKGKIVRPFLTVQNK